MPLARLTRMAAATLAVALSCSACGPGLAASGFDGVGRLLGGLVEREVINAKPGYSGTVPPANFSGCEVARGRWREAHPEAADVPPEYQCLPDGEWPMDQSTPVVTAAAPPEPAPALP